MTGDEARRIAVNVDLFLLLTRRPDDLVQRHKRN